MFEKDMEKAKLLEVSIITVYQLLSSFIALIKVEFYDRK